MPRSAQISIFGRGGILKLKSQSAKICLNFNFWGGILKLKSQSAKICPNFNFREGGYSETEKSKCQDLPTFQFLGGYSETEKLKCQDLPKFKFSGGGGVF